MYTQGLPIRTRQQRKQQMKTLKEACKECGEASVFLQNGAMEALRRKLYRQGPSKNAEDQDEGSDQCKK